MSPPKNQKRPLKLPKKTKKKNPHIGRVKKDRMTQIKVQKRRTQLVAKKKRAKMIMLKQYKLKEELATSPTWSQSAKEAFVGSTRLPIAMKRRTML